MVFRIRNPRLRFLAGLGVEGLIGAVIVGGLYGFGRLLELLWARTGLDPFSAVGDNFLTVWLFGAFGVVVLAVLVMFLSFAALFAKALGDRYF